MSPLRVLPVYAATKSAKARGKVTPCCHHRGLSDIRYTALVDQSSWFASIIFSMSVAIGFLQFLIRPGFRSMFRIR